MTPDEKVTCIALDDQLPPETKKLLALGPGFLIFPDFRKLNKEKTVEQSCDRISICAIAVRWGSYFSQTTLVQTLE